MTKAEEKAAFEKPGTPEFPSEGFIQILRSLAGEQIKSGALKGYLAYVDNVSIGWCNVNDRANFPAESGNGARFYLPPEKREKIVACFEIAPEFRGIGVATALLRRAVSDAKAEGYTAIEGITRKHGKRYEWDFTGPARLYEKTGFVKVSEDDKTAVMRKEL